MMQITVKGKELGPQLKVTPAARGWTGWTLWVTDWGPQTGGGHTSASPVAAYDRSFSLSLASPIHVLLGQHGNVRLQQ